MSPAAETPQTSVTAPAPAPLLVERIDAAVARGETILLTVILTSMIGVAALQAILRNVSTTNIRWADGALQYGTIWVAFLGASIATHRGRHLSMDVLSRILRPRARHASHALTSTFAAAVAFLFAVGFAQFIAGPVRNDTDPNAAEIPAWIAYSVTPVLLGIIGMRFLLRAALAARSAYKDLPWDSSSASG